MRWTWEVTPAITDPDVLTALAQGWSSRDEAEDWLRQDFDLLLEAGGMEVTLLKDGAEVYSMSLEP